MIDYFCVLYDFLNRWTDVVGLGVVIEDGPLRSMSRVSSLNGGPSKANVGILGRCTVLPRTFKLIDYISFILGLRSRGFIVLHDQGGGLYGFIVNDKIYFMVIATFYSSLYDVPH